MSPNSEDFKLHSYADLVILDPYGMVCPSGFHAVVIFDLDFLFKVDWSHCAGSKGHIVDTFTIHVSKAQQKAVNKTNHKTYLKVRQIRNGFSKRTIPPKNERTNSGFFA